jgi:hypothetical protein
MYRSHELPAVFEEHPTHARLTDQMGSPRLWSLPVPLRVKHSGFKDLGVVAPPPPGIRSECFTLSLRGTPHLLTYPGGKHWLVTTLTLPDGSTPTDPFSGEPPHSRVDGDLCKGYMTFSSKGKGYMINVDINRATLRGMATRVLESEPDSRILVRLLPRFAQGAVRWYRDLGCLQFWAAL